MAFIIAHPDTLIMYATIGEAATAAKVRIKDREEEYAPLPIAVYSVEKVITIEPPPVVAPVQPPPPKRFA